eukprot:4124213-Pyramimonas_sp.AAC.1
MDGAPQLRLDHHERLRVAERCDGLLQFFQLVRHSGRDEVRAGGAELFEQLTQLRGVLGLLRVEVPQAHRGS